MQVSPPRHRAALWFALSLVLAGCLAGPAGPTGNAGPRATATAPGSALSGVLGPGGHDLGSPPSSDLRGSTWVVYGHRLLLWSPDVWIDSLGHVQAHAAIPNAPAQPGNPSTAPHWSQARVEGTRVRLYGASCECNIDTPSHWWTSTVVYDPGNDTYGPVQTTGAGESPTAGVPASLHLGCLPDGASVPTGLERLVCLGSQAVGMDANGTVGTIRPRSTEPNETATVWSPTSVHVPAAWRRATWVPGDVLYLLHGRTVLRIDTADARLERMSDQFPSPLALWDGSIAAWLGDRILVLDVFPSASATTIHPAMWAFVPGGHAPNQPPVARFRLVSAAPGTYDNASQGWSAGVAKFADNGSYDPDGGVLTGTWLFGPPPGQDMHSGYDAPPTSMAAEHWMLCPGNFVSFTVTDDAGATNTTRQWVAYDLPPLDWGHPERNDPDRDLHGPCSGPDPRQPAPAPSSTAP